MTALELWGDGCQDWVGMSVTPSPSTTCGDTTGGSVHHRGGGLCVTEGAHEDKGFNPVLPPKCKTAPSCVW